MKADSDDEDVPAVKKDNKTSGKFVAPPTSGSHALGSKPPQAQPKP